MNPLSAYFLGVAIKHHDDFDQGPWERGEGTSRMKTQQTAPARPAAAPPRQRRMSIEAISGGIVHEPHRILIYGVGGVGKSTFLSEAPSPIFIDTQDGTKRLNIQRFPRPETWEDVLEALDVLIDTEHPYKTLAIDLLDDIEMLLWASICKRDGQENIEAYGYGKGYKVALAEWRLLIAKLERVRRKGMLIGFVAHAAIRPFKNPEGEDYDRYTLQIHEQAAGLLRGWCDTVLFARHETVLKTDAKKKRTRGLSTGERLIQTVETAAYYAKNRDNLPDTLRLDWSEFAQAISAGPDHSSIQAEIDELLAQVDDEQLRGAVAQAVANAGGDASHLVRVLNRLREKVAPHQQNPQEQAQ